MLSQTPQKIYEVNILLNFAFKIGQILFNMRKIRQAIGAKHNQAILPNDTGRFFKGFQILSKMEIVTNKRNVYVVFAVFSFESGATGTFESSIRKI